MRCGLLAWFCSRAVTRASTLVASGLLFGCAGHSAHTLEARHALDAHDPTHALKLFNEALDVDKGSEQPSDTSGDVALFLLDRSMVSQQLGAYQDSSRDLQAADKQVEMLDFGRSSADEIGRYLFSDDVGEYKARPFEKLLINTENMVNYLTIGDLSGAKIEARRFAVMQKYLKDTAKDDETVAFLGPGSYLAGFVFDKAGEVDEALRFYDEALAATDYASLREPVARLSERSGYRSPRIHEILKTQKSTADDQSGELLVIVNYGRVPALIAQRVPIGLALTYGALYMNPAQVQGARRLAGQGLVTWVNFPTLEESSRQYAPPGVDVDGANYSVDTITPVDQLMRKAFEKTKGPVIASAIVRMVTRGAVGAGVGAGVGQASDNAGLGMLAALVTQAAMTSVDTPDTRSWATLPARIAIARVRVPAGKHRVQVSAQGGRVAREVQVAAGGFAVVSFTELSQN
jgi:hypothetical protein